MDFLLPMIKVDTIECHRVLPMNGKTYEWGILAAGNDG